MPMFDQLIHDGIQSISEPNYAATVLLSQRMVTLSTCSNVSACHMQVCENLSELQSNTVAKSHFALHKVAPGADLTGGHSCSGRRGPLEAGLWRPRASGASEG